MMAANKRTDPQIMGKTSEYRFPMNRHADSEALNDRLEAEVVYEISLSGSSIDFQD
jgi:hypothetical protein